MSFLKTFQKHKPKNRSVKTALQELAQHMPPAAIGKQFKAEGREVWFWLNAFGIACDNAEPRIFAGARKQGHRALADYFRQRWTQGFQKMAEELGVSRATVEIYHRHFVAGMAQAKGR